MKSIAIDGDRSIGARTLTVLLGTLFSFAPFSIDMYLTAFPTIAAELHTDMGQVQLTLSVFFIGLALGQPLFGPIIDRYGRRWPLIAGMGLYALSSSGSRLSPTFACSSSSGWFRLLAAAQAWWWGGPSSTICLI